MSDIFVSYSNKDKERVRSLIRTLERQGWSVWWDSNIAPGRRFDDALLSEIISSKCVIVVWTANSVGSDWVKDEAFEAGRRNKPLVPILLEDVELPFGFARLEAARLIGWREGADSEELRLLLKTIAALIGQPPKAGKKTRAKEKPVITVPQPAPRRAPGPTAPVLYPYRAGGGTPTSNPASRGFPSASEFLTRQAAWRESPEYKAAMSRIAARREAAEAQRIVFYTSKSWFVSLILLPIVCAFGALLSAWVVRAVSRSLAVELHEVRGETFLLSAAGLVWGLAYAGGGATNAFRWWHFFCQPFLPFMDIISTWSDFIDRLKGMLLSWPLNFLLSLGVAHGLAYVAYRNLAPLLGVNTLLGFSLYEVVVYLIFGVLMLVGLGFYALDHDDYDLLPHMMWTLPGGEK